MNFTCVRRVQGTIAVHVKCKKKSRDCIILVTYLHDFSPNFHESCACTHSTSLRSVRSRSFAIWTMDSIKKCLQNWWLRKHETSRFSRRPIYKREIDAFLRRISVHLIFSLNLKWAVKGMVCQESSGKTFQFDFLQKTSCYSKLSIEWEKLTIEKCSAASCAKPDNLSSFKRKLQNLKVGLCPKKSRIYG